MGSKQIRLGQLIAPFGPGSIYTDRHGIPHVVAGLDHWHKTWDEVRGCMVECSKPDEFEIFEPRLAELLRVDRFRSPPDYRFSVFGQTPPPNAWLLVPALRFPRWYRNTQSGEMHRFNLESRVLGRPSGGGRWQPVRFIAVCGGGHLCEFPWKEWIDCQCEGDGNLVLTDRGGSELTSITVRCQSCPEGSTGRKGKSLSGTTTRPDADKGEKSEFQKASIRCPGDTPWLGEHAAGRQCAEPLVGALINQTNIYFPRTVSAISLPDLEIQDDSVAALRVEIDKLAEIGAIKSLWRLGAIDPAVGAVSVRLKTLGISFEPDKVKAALESLFSPDQSKLPAGAPVPRNPESELQRFRRAEFNVIRQEVDDPVHVPNLRVLAGRVPRELSTWIGSAGLVERLCETRVFFGFDRLEPSSSPLAEMPNSAMEQLFRNPSMDETDRWLPAVEVFGEGIYIELREEQLASWQRDNSDWIRERLTDRFLARLQEVCWALGPLQGADVEWASRFLVVHSLAHILINQLVFECGYSTASLRERLFVSADPDAPMAGLLIYTAAGDSEGTLGGLVRLAQPDLLGPMVLRALSRASWCSADPVCSENLGGQGSRLANLAACHACTLLPETSCETINQGLDRGMIVGTPVARHRGFLSQLLETSPDTELGDA